MTTQEITFLEDHLIKLISGNKHGVSMESILEYLDYVNKVVYSEPEIMPLLENLIRNQKVLKEGDVYIRC